MRKDHKCRRGTWLLLLCLVPAVLVYGCGSKPQPSGTYVSDATASPRHGEATLDLKDNGVGVWKVGDEEVSFTWFMKGDELRVHTKSGGVLVGTVEDNAIKMAIPGSNEMAFKKVK